MSPLRAVVGLGVAFSTVDLSLPGGVRMHFGMLVLQVGEVDQDKFDGTPYRFPNADCFWRQHRPTLHIWPWSESETGNRLTGGLPPG
ncbi:MAG: hypothetical protein NTY36_17920 [Deltaproteobacteria bacterium]|nr:hypothetical protein [Deltaproteobacteria bacterium]